MASFRTAVSGFALLALAGCNATLDPVSPKESLPGYLTVSSGMPVPYLFQGSAIQWNQHYAVSAAHIPMLPDVVHRCSTGCDLVFIRREAEGPVPNWRPTVVGETLEVVGLSPSLVTVRGIGVSKATTLARFADELGISAEDVVAFGDMPNDLPMLAWAGTAYAVANAHPLVLEAVDNTTASNNDDGVADVVEQLFAS